RASTLALTLIRESRVYSSFQNLCRRRGNRTAGVQTRHSARHSPNSTPIVLHRWILLHEGVEVGVFLQHNLTEDVVLPGQHCLQAYQFQDSEKCTDQRSPRSQAT